MNRFICSFVRPGLLQSRAKYLAVVAIGLLLGSQTIGIVKAQTATATSSFLRIGVDARGVSMGGAQGAHTESVYSMYWNPAGLSNVFLKEIGVTYYRAFQDLSYSFLGYAVPVVPYGTIGLQAFFLGTGSIISTSENPDGSFAGTGDSFSVYDLGFGISQSKRITRNLAYGISLKLLAHKIMNEQAFALAGDVGVIYHTAIEELKAALVLQNVSTKYSFISQDLREPWGVRLATVYSLIDQPLVLTADYNFVPNQQDTLNLGAEYWFLEMLALRAGMRLPSAAGLVSVFNLGFGINWRELYELDYSFSPHTELGINQRFSLIVRF
jgi:hypothetical protein